MASSSSSNPPKHDVFLSFRREDTGKNFTSYLYDALCRKQIETFTDDDELRTGDEISPSVRNAIQDASLSIIIFSQNYASSTWCLNELVEILECFRTRRQIVVPVLYHVTPSNIRKQTGAYKKAFDEHERSFKKANDKVQKWRAALTQVANLSGWDLDQHDGTESEFVENIARDVLKRLNHMSSSVCFDGLVGINSRIESIESLLCMEMENVVRIIGIWGMGGIGKTTIARALLLRIANQFECHCFLENVKDIAKFGPNHLQEKLLSEICEDQNVYMNAFTVNRLRRKKVLIVLDDVDDLDHLDLLVRGHSSFRAGSRIIITSRDKQVLKNGVDELYELEELNYDEALQLFSANAFKQNHPPENYIELSHRIIHYAKGNPLALKVLGCFLFGRNMLEWKNSLKKLKRYPNFNIQNILKISYDGLDYQEKEIFLSIACFFRGVNKDRVLAILNNCGLFADIGIAILIDKCFVMVRLNLLQMHDLMQEMGRGIVLQESINEPGKRSRLWDPQDILDLFKRNSGTDVVESISLNLSQISDQLHLSPDAFMRMPGLKFLKFYESLFYEDYNQDKLHLSQGLEFLPDELRYLHWHGYPLKSLPSNFKPNRRVELEMPYSNIEQLWKEDQPLENLKRIDLSHSQHLTAAPSISQVPNLEVMVLYGCSSLTKFPRIPCNIKDLHLSFTAIEEIPPAIESLKKLVNLRLDNCTRLKNLPRSIRHLTSLTLLDVHGCPSITEFPETSGNIEYLLLGDTGIEEVPSSVGHLTKLSKLSLRSCTRLKRVSRGIFKSEFLSELSLEGCSELENSLAIDEEEEVSSSVELLPLLTQLGLRYCKNIASFPILSCNLRSLYVLDLSGYSEVDKMLDSLPISSLSNLCSLKGLNLSECKLSVLPCALSYLTSLRKLDLSGNNFEILSLKPFSCLQTLQINHCERLRSLQDFPVPSCVEIFEAQNCISLETLPTSNVVFTGNWDIQQKFRYFNCFNLDEIARINILADARLRTQLMANNMQKRTKLRSRLSSHSVCFPESEIPEWIKAQNEGSSVTIDLPPNWYNNKFFGFTTCIVATFEGKHYDSLFFVQWTCKFLDYDGEPHVVLCHVDYLTVGDPHSDHLYLATPHSDWYNVYEGDDDIGDNLSSLEKFSSCQKALFEFFIVDTEMYIFPDYEIKRCGVSLLYAEDVESVESRVDSSSDETAEVCAESGRDGISKEEEYLINSEPQVNEHWNCSFGSCFSFLFQRWS